MTSNWMTRTFPFKSTLSILALAALTSTTACGPTQEELNERDRTIASLKTDLANQKAADEAKYDDAKKQIDALTGQLSQAGTDASKLQEALAEYKTRADQLAAIEQRFRDLKSRLDKLTQFGLKVVVRKNRMVIQLPGDILFDSGKDELKTGGKDVLGQVADVIRGDKDLNSRNFQVAGDTDNAKYTSGPFHDNWGLSLARARQVLLFLISPNTPAKATPTVKTGGGLDPNHWAAAGYGETDPIAGTVTQQTAADQKKNRRVELVVQPNVEEMLNLDALQGPAGATSSAAPAPAAAPAAAPAPAAAAPAATPTAK